MNKLLKMFGMCLLAVPGILTASDGGVTTTGRGCNGNGNGERTDYTSHTFYSIRPQFQSQSPEKVAFFREDRMYMDCDGWGGAFQLVFFGGETRRGKDLAKWFFPFGKTELLVQEGLEVIGALGQFAQRDIDPAHFNIETNQGNFQSRISICPEQSTFGIGFDWKQMLTCKDDGTMGFWGEISFPVMRVRNRLNFKEQVINTGGGPSVAGQPANMREAFQQAAFRFGRIGGTITGGNGEPCNGNGNGNGNGNCNGNGDCLEEWGVADVEIKAGYNFIESECFHLNGWVGVVAPTSDRPKGVRVFEPILGHNDHVGVMIGGSYGYDCWESECGVWRVEADLVSKYFTEDCEIRSVDVMDKQWSRYMKVFRNAADAAAGTVSDGINVFTLKMDIEPRFTFNYNTALIYDHDSGFSVEIGYNFWVRQAEKICRVSFPDAPQFVDAVNPETIINPARTINHNFILAQPISAADNYIPLTVNDLNFNSAAHPAALSQTFYGGVNYDWELCGWPMFTSVLGSYEFSANNAALHRWLVAGKLGFAF